MTINSHSYQALALDETSDAVLSSPPARRAVSRLCLHGLAVIIPAIVLFLVGRHSAFRQQQESLVDDLVCRPFLPDVFAEDPPSPSDSGISAASSTYHAFLQSEFATRDIDGLSVAVVTSTGTLFEDHWGLLRANESSIPSRAPNSFSQYRVASISKLLLVYEAFLLEQRGIISWDDPVALHLPVFQPDHSSFTEGTTGERPLVTLRHLATHQSGLGHDWPPGTTSRFPFDVRGGGAPPTNGLPFPSHEDVFAAIRSTPLVVPPGSTPVYSNTAFGVLGMALVTANRAHGGDAEPTTIAALMERDVFSSLGMTGTHYHATSQNRDQVVVPAIGTEIIDMDFLDAMNPSGGMFTSLHDLAIVLRTLLNPATGPLTRATVTRWMRPVYSFAEDDWTENGIAWEIFKHTDSHGRRRRLYTKLGELGVMHAAVGLHPGSGYAIIVLVSGTYADAARLAYSGFDIFQPALDAALLSRAAQLYAGTWRSSGNGNRTSSAHISVRRGTLWMDSYVLEGHEVLWCLFGAKYLPLRSTSRRDEMRLDAGLRSQNGLKHRGCMPHWAAYDSYGMRGGAAVNLIYFTGGIEKPNERLLHVPSLQLTMQRVR